MAPHTLASVSAEVVDKVEVKTALVSVFDKTGLDDLGKFLAQKGVHILSTGGTAAKLRELGCTVQDVADYTGSPEILDGRVKTLHPKVHGGLLAARGNASHEAEMDKHGIRKIDLVIVNLYPFQQAVAKGLDFANCIENIDIGGPAMIRASAKNNAAVAICTSPSQYAPLMEQISANAGCTTFDFRKNLAAAAFALTSAYDSAVSGWLAGQVTEPPATQTVAFQVERPLKYGCNPHQLPAGLCSVSGLPLPFEVVAGTPGYINLLDAVNAWQLVYELAKVEKQSRHLKRWKKRWFVLQDSTLYSFKKERQYDDPTEVIDLRVFSSVKSSEDYTNRTHSFDVYSAEMVFSMVAASESEKEDWIRAIGRAIVISRTKSWQDDEGGEEGGAEHKAKR